MSHIQGMNKQIVTSIIIISVSLFIGIIIFHFPLQRIWAEKAYYLYASQQGVSDTDIKSINFFKDYTQGGYYANVYYHSDPEHRYTYRYTFKKNTPDGVKYHFIDCFVFDSKSHSASFSNYENVVYKPLK